MAVIQKWPRLVIVLVYGDWDLWYIEGDLPNQVAVHSITLQYCAIILFRLQWTSYNLTTLGIGIRGVDTFIYIIKDL